MRIVVCEAQVPFVARRRRSTTCASWCGSCARAATGRARERARSSGIRRRKSSPHAAAWRLLDLSESNGTPIDLVIALEVPDLLRAPPAQGGVAHSPVPRRLRAVRHGVQRLRATSSSTSACASADRASTPRCSASAARVFTNAQQHRRSRSRGTTALDGRSRCIIRRGWRRGSAAGPLGDYVLSVGRIEIGQARRPGGPGAGAGRRRRLRLVVAGDGTQRANVERVAHECGVADRVDVSRRRSTTRR